MKRGWSFSLLLLLLSSAVPAVMGQGLPPGIPQELGLSPERLSRIDDVVQGYVDKGQLAGAVTLVARHGQVAQLGTYGMMDREKGIPMRVDTLFRIASMSKPITSVAALILYEEGRFMLTDPVSTYIPSFEHIKVLPPEDAPNQDPVEAVPPPSIWNLFTHTSGLGYHWNPRVGEMYQKAGINHGLLEDENTLAEDVDSLAGIPLLFPPGERFNYGLSVDVLGRVVEVASGMSLDEFLHERLFEPLGMKDTCFYLPEDKKDRLAAVYKSVPEGGIERISESVQEGPTPMTFSVTYPYNGPRRSFAGGGGLVSSISDYARFAQMMLNGGELDGVRILSSKTVEWATQDHLAYLDEGPGFGLGFAVNRPSRDLKELGSPGSYHWGGFFYTSFQIDPAEDLIVVFMAQLHPAGDLKLRDQIKTLAYQAIVD